MFYEPHHVAAGGATGIAILVKEIAGVSLSTTLIIFNVAMLILSYFFLGKIATARITFGSIVLPIFLAITPDYMVIKGALLSSIIGSIIFGFGLSILYRLGSSAGGTTVPPMIFKKYFHIRNANSLFVLDGIICLGNIFVSGFEEFFLAILSVGISTIVMNYVQTGLDKKIVFYVMSEDHLNDIHEEISKRLTVGGTFIAVRGGHSKDHKEMLMLVADTQDYGTILDIIYKVDKNAFILSDTVAEMHNGSL